MYYNLLLTVYIPVCTLAPLWDFCTTYERIFIFFHCSGSNETTQQPVPLPSSGSVDLSELLSEIRHLRLQLERSIQTNTALRQKLEEQLLRGPNRSETININYLLSSPGKLKAQPCVLMISNAQASVLIFTFVPDEGGRSPGREGCDPLRHSFQSHHEHTSVLHGESPCSALI